MAAAMAAQSQCSSAGSAGLQAPGFEERLEGLQGLWQETSGSQLWVIDGTTAIKVHWRTDRHLFVPTGCRSTISAGERGTVVWGKEGTIYLDPGFRPKDRVAKWRQRIHEIPNGIVAFAWTYRGPAPKPGSRLWAPESQKSTGDREEGRRSRNASPNRVRTPKTEALEEPAVTAPRQPDQPGALPTRRDPKTAEAPAARAPLQPAPPGPLPVATKTAGEVMKMVPAPRASHLPESLAEGALRQPEPPGPVQPAPPELLPVGRAPRTTVDIAKMVPAPRLPASTAERALQQPAPPGPLPVGRQPKPSGQVPKLALAEHLPASTAEQALQQPLPVGRLPRTVGEVAKLGLAPRARRPPASAAETARGDCGDGEQGAAKLGAGQEAAAATAEEAQQEALRALRASLVTQALWRLEVRGDPLIGQSPRTAKKTARDIARQQPAYVAAKEQARVERDERRLRKRLWREEQGLPAGLRPKKAAEFAKNPMAAHDERHRQKMLEEMRAQRAAEREAAAPPRAPPNEISIVVDTTSILDCYAISLKSQNEDSAGKAASWNEHVQEDCLLDIAIALKGRARSAKGGAAAWLARGLAGLSAAPAVCPKACPSPPSLPAPRIAPLAGPPPPPW